jgi:hypothetical protein
MTASAVVSPSLPPSGRDLRLDFFRGLALIFIFVDHIPDNLVANFTIRNIGFSDATEMFVFISGYTAGLVYLPAMLRDGWLFASARIWRRVWQLYMAHIALFVIFTAQVAWTAAQFDNPAYAEEMNVARFLQEPHIAIIQALLLSFKPVNLDVLPLYIVLLLGFPPVLYLLARARAAVLLLSFALYAAASIFKWNLPGYPEGSEWFFNPLAWQVLFVLGAALGTRAGTGAPGMLQTRLGAKWLRHPAVLTAAIAYLVFSFVFVVSWQFVEDEQTLWPAWLLWILNPLSKTYLSPWRLLHFLTLAYVAMRLFRRDNPFFASRAAHPLLLIGESSLQMFCLGVFLSFAAHFILVEFDDEPWTQLLVNAGGIAIMLTVAATIHWYKTTERGRAAAQRRRATTVGGLAQ